MLARTALIRRLRAKDVPEVLIIGGGINGVGIARDLAGRGWRVLLCEQDDLGSHTSSASTKLIHGGLRYLEHGAFGLVRKAQQLAGIQCRAQGKRIQECTHSFRCGHFTAPVSTGPISQCTHQVIPHMLTG